MMDVLRKPVCIIQIFMDGYVVFKIKKLHAANFYVGSNPDATMIFYRKVPTSQASYTTNLYYFRAIN